MKQGQKSIINKLIRNNSGQAVVEYVLLAIIVVSLVIGIGKVFKVIDDGFNQYMGGYIACLMEYGELPSLGVREADLKKHTSSTGKKCDAEFGSFSFAEGRPPTGGGGSSGSSGSGSSNQAAGNGRGGSNSDRNADGSGNGNGSGNSVGDGSGDENETANGFARGSGGGGGRGSDRSKRSTTNQGGYATADAPTEFENTKTRVIEEEDDVANSEKNRSRKRRNLTNNGGYEPYRAITGRMKQELEKQQSRRSTPRQPIRTVTTISKEEVRFAPTRKTLSRNVAAEGEEMKDSGNNFSFGNIIKWLLIAAIVLSIIVFFGGQVLNYSNSKD